MPASGAWTESEKIIEKSGLKINYDELVLPDGRTQKACTVMIDRERQKIRKAAQAAKGEGINGDAAAAAAAGGEGDEEAIGNEPKDGAASPNKRKAKGDTAGAGGKKAKKGQVKAEPDDELFQ